MATKVLSRGLRRRTIIPLIIAVAAVAIVGFLVFASLSPALLRAVGQYSIPGVSRVSAKLGNYEFPWTSPNVEGASASPESLGMYGSKREALIESLPGRDTAAFIVVTGNPIVAEW